MANEKIELVATKNFTTRIDSEVFHYKKGDKITHKYSPAQKKKYKEKGLVTETVDV